MRSWVLNFRFHHFKIGIFYAEIGVSSIYNRVFFYAAISGNNDLFTIKMYHGGQLSEDFYVGGNEDFFDYCDKDFMSLLEVDNIVEELGYGNIFMSYQYRFLGMEIRNGLKPLMTDSDVINMCKFVPNHTLIDVYIEKITPEECVSQK